MNTYNDIHEAYLETLRDVYYNYDYVVSPRGLSIREKLDYTFKVKFPKCEPIKTKDEARNAIIKNYTQKETELYESLSNNAEDFARASKFWKTIANPDGTVNSAYGHLIWAKKSHGNTHFQLMSGNMPEMYTPWEWAMQSLIRDKETRQAIVRFSLPEHQWLGNKDQTCTMHANFLIREDKLNLSVVMRSNDLVLGLVYDLPWFVSLMDKMIGELKAYYPDLSKGQYTHTVHSLHIYEKNEDVVKKMLGI